MLRERVGEGILKGIYLFYAILITSLSTSVRTVASSHLPNAESDPPKNCGGDGYARVCVTVYLREQCVNAFCEVRPNSEVLTSISSLIQHIFMRAELFTATLGVTTF